MWILAPWGALMPSLRKNCPKDDPRVIQIRFRRVKDAVRCSQEYLPRTLDKNSPIITDAGTDYDARIYVRPESLMVVMNQLVDDINYTSFKDQTTIQYGDKQLHDAYYAIWRVLYDRLSTRKAFTRRPAAIDHGYVPSPGEPIRWTKRIERTETETVQWKRIADMTDHELELYMRQVDQAEPTDDDLREIDAELGDITKLLEGPIARPDGQLDHSDCRHRKARSARQACRRQWLKSQDKGGKK